jgi:nitroreductase
MSINPVDYPVNDAIANRWSPYLFQPKEIEDEKLTSCLEAARWSASSFNDQPWFWIIARRQDPAAFAKMVGCLLEANQAWAQDAGALILTAIRPTFAHNQTSNRVALHDLGQAACQLVLQAATIGLQAHQMAGINLSLIRQEYAIPPDIEPQTAIAIGYPRTEEPASEDQKRLRKRESGGRSRRRLSEQVFENTWGKTATFLR